MAGTFAFREMFRAITRLDWILHFVQDDGLLLLRTTDCCCSGRRNAKRPGRRDGDARSKAGMTNAVGFAREAHSFVSRLQGSARSFVYLISNGGIGSDSPDFIALSRAADLTGSTHQ